MSADAKAPDDTPAKPATEKKPRPWRRRLVRIAIVLVALVVVLRVALALLLPTILGAVVSDYGLEIDWASLRLGILAGDLELRDLTLTPEEGGEPVVRLRYARVDVSTWSLVSGPFTVNRVEVDGLDVTLDRDAEGRWSLLERFRSDGPDAAETTEAAPEDESEPSRLSLTAPIVVRELRVQNVRATIRDAVEDFETTIDANLALTDLGPDAQDTRLELLVTATDVMEALHVRAGVASAAAEAAATIDVRLRGLRPGPLAAYLEPMGVRPVADRIDAGLTAGLEATVVDAEAGSVRLALTVDDVTVLADGDEAAGLDRILVEAPEIGPARIDVARVEIAGGRWIGESRPDGSFRTCGVDLVPVEPTPVASGAPGTSEPEPAGQPTGDPRTVHVRDVVVRDLTATIRVPGDEPIVTRLESLTVRAGDLGPDAALALDGRLVVPGILDELRLEGEVAPFAFKKTLRLAFRASGLRPARLRHQLAASGIEALFERGDLGFEVAAEVETGDVVRAKLSLADLRFDAGDERLALGHLRVGGVALDAEAGLNRIESIDLGGLRFDARREADGALRALGFRFRPVEAGAAPASEPAVAGADPAPVATTEKAPPRLEIGRVILSDNRIVLDDNAVEPAATIDVAELTLEVKDIAGGGGADPGVESFGLTARVAGVAERIAIRGSVRPEDGALVARTEVAAAGSAIEALAPYLSRAGLDSELIDHALGLRIEARVARGEGDMRADVRVEDVVFSSAGRELAGLDAVRIEGLRLAGDELSVEAVRVLRPRLTARRDAAGDLHALGFRIGTPAARPAPAGPAAMTGASPGTPAAAAPESRLRTLVDLVEIRDARLHWTDETTPGSPVTVTPTLGFEAKQVRLEGDAVSAQAHLGIRTPETGSNVLARMRIERTATDLTRAAVHLSGTRLTTGALAPYLPPGIEVTMREGDLQALVRAEIAPSAAGGRRIEAEIREVTLRDGEESLLVLESLKAVASRLDPEAGVFVVDEISTKGLATKVTVSTDGTTHLLGLALKPVEPEARPAVTPSGAEEGAKAGGTTQPEDARARLRARLAENLPEVTVRTLDLGVASLSYHDESKPEALRVENLRVFNPEPLEVLGEHPDKLSPLVLRIEGSVPPAFGSVAGTIRLSPFADEPEAGLDLVVSGIDGEGMARVLPGLEESVEPGGLRGGTFRMKATAHLRARRKSALELDLERGFGAELIVESVTLVNGDGEELAGVDEILVDVKRVDPKTGSVHIGSIEIVKPRGDVRREAEGLRVLGLRLATKSAAGGDGEASPSTSSGSPSSAPDGATAGGSGSANAEPEPGPEIRIDSIYVAELRSRIEDRSVQPPLVMPIKDLTVEIRNFSTRAFTETRSIQFSAVLRSDEIDVPHEEGKRRAAVEEIAAAGRVSLHPQLGGWVKLGVSALELSNLSGQAKDAGVDLTGGALDLGISVRFRKDGSADTSVRASLVDLALDEPPDGPISRWLKLPAPLNVVIFVLEDSGGALDIPLDFRVDSDGVGGGAIATEAIKVLTLLIADAIASSPFKVVGGVGGIFGIGGEDEPEPDEPPIGLPFAPGDTLVRLTEGETLAAIVERLRDDDELAVTIRHELGRGDEERMHRRANPSPEDARALLDRVRRRKVDVLAARETASAEARVAFAVGRQVDIDRATARLAALDRDLGAAELAIDRLAGFLKPGADRQGRRRTRAACTTLAEMRLREVSKALRAAGIERADERIRVRKPRFAEPEIDGGGRVWLSLAKAAVDR